MQIPTNSIGVINKVFPYKIVIEIPDTTKINYNFRGDLYVCDGINTFITIYKSFNHKFIYQISSLYEIEKPYDLQDDESKFTNKAFFDAIPVGEIQNGKFQYGVSKFPMIGEEVYLTSIDDLNNILLMENQTWYLTLGTLTTHESFIPKFSIDTLLTTHICILGNTGSGKSTTVRKLLNEIVVSAKREDIEINDANFIVFDVHEEYDSLPEDITNTVCVSDEISIPLETLTLEDWINLVQPSSQVQLPVLMNGLRFAYLLDNNGQSISDWMKVFCALELYNNQQTDTLPKRTKIVTLLENIEDNDIQYSLTQYNSKFGNFPDEEEEKKFKENLKQYIKEKSGYDYEDCKYYITELLQEVQCSTSSLLNLQQGIELTLLLEESKGNHQVRSHCQTLMTRIYNLIATYSKSLLETNEEKIKKFNEILEFKKAFTKFNVSGLEDNDLLFFTGYLLRTIYQKQRESRENNKLSKLYHFIFDEAHKYITEESEIKSIKIFEQVAKEGRKFGLFMILASQRPGELSKTVLSQCNNFILHRIRNNCYC